MGPANLQETIANNVRYYRIEKGYSQAGFAAVIGRSRQWVSHVETGVRRLNTEHIELLAEKLGVKVNDLLVWHDLGQEFEKGAQRISVRLIRTIV